MSEQLTVNAVLQDEYGFDWRARGMFSHVAEVINTYRTDYRDVLVFSSGLVSARDVYGYDEPVAVANYRTLYADWQWCDALITSVWSNVDSIGLYLDEPCPDGLTDIIDALADNPLLDEQLWSEVEQEFITEHYESYGRYDVLVTVSDVLGCDVSDLTEYAEQTVDTLVWSGLVYLGNGSEYPSMIDVSACEFGAEAIAQWFRARLGRVVTLPSRWSGDEPRRFDMRRSALVRAA